MDFRRSSSQGGKISFAFLEDLLVVTIINFVVVFSSTIAILYSVDKLKEKYGKKDKDE